MLQTGFGKQGGRLVLGEEAWAGRKPQETRAEGKRCVVWKRWLNLGDRNEVLMLESYRKMRLIFYANRAAQFTRSPAECGWHHFIFDWCTPTARPNKFKYLFIHATCRVPNEITSVDLGKSWIFNHSSVPFHNVFHLLCSLASFCVHETLTLLLLMKEHQR